jgi:hypothetical protein
MNLEASSDYAGSALDFALLLLVVGSFGLLVTVHVALVAGLFFRKPHWRGLIALLVPPFAPYWGWEQRMRLRAALWLLALSTYAVSLTASAL